MRRFGLILLSLSILLVLSIIAVSADSQVEDSTATPTVDPPFFLRSWGAEGDLIRNPSAVAITDGPTIFVSNTSMNRITRITSDQRFFNWGEFGRYPGRFFWPGGIAIDAQENLYVVDADTPGRIQKFSRDGQYITTWDKGVGGENLKQVQDLDVAPNGDVYVSETGADRVLVFNADGQLINHWGGTGDGDGEFSSPYGIALDPDGSYVYVADRVQARIQKFDSTGQFIRTWGEYGDGEGQFKKPWRIAIDSQNRVYVTDVETQYIQIFDSNGAFLARWGGPEMFFLPRGIEIDLTPRGVDEDGNPLYRDDVFVADLSQVRRFPRTSIETLFDPDKDPDVRSDKYWGQDPTDLYHSAPGIYIGSDGRVYTTDRGLAGEEVGLLPPEKVVGNVNVFDHMGVRVEDKWPKEAGDDPLKRPGGISGDSEGNSYVADAGTHRIVKYNRQGQQVRKWGKQGTNTGEFSYPLDLTVNALDLVFVADTLNHRVQKFDSAGNFLDEWVVPGEDPIELRGPTSVTTDNNFVYIFNLGNMRVQKFDLDGNLVKDWGGAGSGNGEFGVIQKFRESDLGTDREALIHEAPRLAVYNDWLLATDPANNRVQVFDKEGTYLTQWGNYGSGAAEFTRELDVDVAPNGEIYVADMGGHRIQVFSFERPPTTGMVINGSFGNEPALTGWHHSRDRGRDLPSTREETGGAGKYALLLGKELASSEDASEINTQAWAHQTIFVDPAIERPVLSFRYNMWVNNDLHYVDFLAVLEDATGINRLSTIVQAGYSCGNAVPAPRSQLGWRAAKYDLSPFAGQTIRLVFYNRYLHPKSLGIWTYVDDVMISSEPHWATFFAPVVAQDGKLDNNLCY